MTLLPIDYFAIATYFFALLVIGYFSSKKQTNESFLISDRKLGLLSGMATINATKTGAIILIFTAALYMFGFSAMWYFIGISLGYLVFLPFCKKIHQKSNSQYYTFADYFYFNYGKTASIFASIINLITMFGFLVINLIASATVFEYFTGLSFALSSILVAGIIFIYLLMGGFKAVVHTDILQYFAIVFILVAFAFILFGDTTIPAKEWNLLAAGPGNIFGFLLIGVLFPFASPDLWQRIYAFPSYKILKKSLILSVVSFLLVAMVLAFVGLLIKVRLPYLDPDVALIHGFAQLLPAGLSGLAIVVFFAAFMSSIDTYIYTASSSLIQDFFKKLSKTKTISAIRIVMFSITILATLVSILIGDLLEASFLFAAFVVVLAIPAIITWIKPSVHKTTLNIGFAIGITLLTFFVIFDYSQNNLSPVLVVKGIVASLLGLAIGAVYSKIKKPPSSSPRQIHLT